MVWLSSACQNQLDFERMKVEAFAQKATIQLMQKDFQNTGQKPTGKVLDWRYNETTKQYEIKMVSNWEGSANMLLALLGKSCEVSIVGDLVVNHDGSKPTYQKTTIVSPCGVLSELDSLQILQDFYPKGYLTEKLQ